MKKFLFCHEKYLGHEKFPSTAYSRRAIVSLLAKECALSTGKLPRRLAQEQCG